MEKIKILVVEDQVLQARDLVSALQNMNYEVVGEARDSRHSIRLLDELRPDLALIDIRLAQGNSGIDVAEWIKQEHPIPFIFITASEEMAIFEKAKKTMPYGYLIKPYTREDLYRTIELALLNFSTDRGQNGLNNSEREYIFLKDGRSYRKLRIHEILWIEADGNYKKFYGLDRKLIANPRLSMEEIEQILPAQSFIRIHKSFLVNMNKITRLESDQIWIEDFALPIGRNYQDNIQKLMNRG